MHKHTKHIIVFVALALTGAGFSGCGNRGSIQAGKIASQDPNENTSGVGATPIQEVVNPLKPQICSKLSYNNISWPSALDQFQINAFAMAMNISGSFEGHEGWKNLTNNFDGQGISLGLFNQNLGQGSLQPLMINLRKKNNTAMRSFFTSAQYTSVDGMLTKWGGKDAGQGKATVPYHQYESDISDLDDPSLVTDDDIGVLMFEKGAINAKSQASVNWAVANVFKGSSFKPEWKTALQKMSGSPQYVTEQVVAAIAIHNKAMGYMKKLKFKELRAYLFFFDVVVQNGGVTTNIENQYLNWYKSNSGASETTRLKKILEYRLVLVINQYKNDVKARKTAVIDGAGTVHGSKRDFKKELCVTNWGAKFPSSAALP